MQKAENLNFVRFTFSDISLLERKELCSDPSLVIVYDCTSANVQAELTWLHYQLKQIGLQFASYSSLALQ